jgi:hypothetical protein
MPRPTTGTTLQRPDLAALAWEYMLSAPEVGYIGTQILPVFETDEQTADYPVIPIEAILKNHDTHRSPRGTYNRSDYEFETGTYKCVEHGWEEALDDVERNLYRRFFDGELVATTRAMDIILRDQERRIAALTFNVGFLNNGAVAIEWNLHATCTPRADVMDAKETMRRNQGVYPNAMAISLRVLHNLMASQEITSAFQYTQPLQTMNMMQVRQVLAQYFGVDYLLVGGAQSDDAHKGQAFALADIWDDEYCLLFRKAPDAQNLMDPCLGRTFLWTADSPSNTVIESYRDETRRSDIYRVRQYTDETFVFTGAGYLLTNITEADT